jgi:hypothetical protein
MNEQKKILFEKLIALEETEVTYEYNLEPPRPDITCEPVA